MVGVIFVFIGAEPLEKKKQEEKVKTSCRLFMVEKKILDFLSFSTWMECGGKQRRSHTTPIAAVIRWVRPEVVNSLTVLCNGCPAASVLVNDLFFHFNSFENYHRKIHNHGTYMKRNLGFCIGNVEVSITWSFIRKMLTVLSTLSSLKNVFPSCIFENI